MHAPSILVLGKHLCPTPLPPPPTLSVTMSAARQSLKNSARSSRRLASVMA
jgi:hypothetical protein